MPDKKNSYKLSKSIEAKFDDLIAEFGTKFEDAQENVRKGFDEKIDDYAENQPQSHQVNTEEIEDRFIELEAKLIKQETSWGTIFTNLANINDFPKGDQRRRAAKLALLLKFIPGPGATAVTSGGLIATLIVLLELSAIHKQNSLIEEYESSNRDFALLSALYKDGRSASSLRNHALNEYIRRHGPTFCQERSIFERFYDWLLNLPECEEGKGKYLDFEKNPLKEDEIIEATLENLNMSLVDLDYENVDLRQPRIHNAELDIRSDVFMAADLNVTNSDIKIESKNTYFSGKCRFYSSQLTVRFRIDSSKAERKSESALNCDYDLAIISLEFPFEQDFYPQIRRYFNHYFWDSRISNSSLFVGRDTNFKYLSVIFNNSSLENVKVESNRLIRFIETSIDDASLIFLSGEEPEIVFEGYTSQTLRDDLGIKDEKIEISSRFVGRKPITLNFEPDISRFDLSKADFSTALIANPEVLEGVNVGKMPIYNASESSRKVK